MRRSIAAAAMSLALLLMSSGCMWQEASGVIQPGGVFGTGLSGTVTGFPINGTFLAVLGPGSGAGDPGCGRATFPVTLTDAAGDTLTKQETGQFCITVAGLHFTGQYTITGGTGRYQGATGNGTTNIQYSAQAPWTFTSQEIGTFDLPGTGQAASKRTFKLRGTVSTSVKQCKRAGPRARISRRGRHCVMVVGSRVRILPR